MGDKYKFAFKHYKERAWHIGAFFGVGYKQEDGKKDIYLLFFFGSHDFLIGFLHEYE